MGARTTTWVAVLAPNAVRKRSGTVAARKAIWYQRLRPTLSIGQCADEGGEDAADRGDDLVEQEEPAAFARGDELVDVGAGHRHPPAGADSLQEAEHDHGCGAA